MLPSFFTLVTLWFFVRFLLHALCVLLAIPLDMSGLAAEIAHRLSL